MRSACVCVLQDTFCGLGVLTGNYSGDRFQHNTLLIIFLSICQLPTDHYWQRMGSACWVQYDTDGPRVCSKVHRSNLNGFGGGC
jgi:hypothetical protein